MSPGTVPRARAVQRHRLRLLAEESQVERAARRLAGGLGIGIVHGKRRIASPLDSRDASTTLPSASRLIWPLGIPTKLSPVNF